MKTAITDCWKNDLCCLFKIESLIQSSKTTFADKQKTSKAKFNEKPRNLDSYSTNGKQNFKQSKTVQ